MRTPAAALIALLLLATPTALAQERVIEYSTSVQPDLYVFDQEAYQRDENGDRVRDDDGRYKLEPQYVTVRAEASMECAVAPDGEEMKFLTTAGRHHLRNASTQEIYSTYFDLEPRTFNLTWRQDALGEDWYAEGVVQVQIISNGIPRNTINEDRITWQIEQMDIPQACPQDGQRFDAPPHTIIIPGFDFEPSDFNITEEDLPGGKQTPAPGAAVLLAGIGLVAALRRRSV